MQVNSIGFNPNYSGTKKKNNFAFGDKTSEFRKIITEADKELESQGLKKRNWFDKALDWLNEKGDSDGPLPNCENDF